MAQLKTINRIIGNDYPFMELVKGSSYFYFASIGSESGYIVEHRALGNLASTSVHVARVSDLTVKQWVQEASNVYEKMKNSSHSLCEKIKRDEEKEKSKKDYFVKYHEKDGSINTRQFTAFSDDEAKESLTRYDDLEDVQLFKRIV